MFFSAYMFAARMITMMTLVHVIAWMLVVIASEEASNVFVKTASGSAVNPFGNASGKRVSLIYGNF